MFQDRCPFLYDSGTGWNFFIVWQWRVEVYFGWLAVCGGIFCVTFFMGWWGWLEVCLGWIFLIGGWVWVYFGWMGVREHFLWTSWGVGRGMFWVDGHFLTVGGGWVKEYFGWLRVGRHFLRVGGRWVHIFIGGWEWLKVYFRWLEGRGGNFYRWGWVNGGGHSF